MLTGVIVDEISLTLRAAEDVVGAIAPATIVTRGDINIGDIGTIWD